MAGVLCLSGAILPAALHADISLPFAPPPMALDRRADVVDGGRVDIPLGVSGAAQGITYEFIIRGPPTKGRLDGLRAFVAGDAATVTYTHNPTLGGGTDSFTYAVQRAGGGPVSSPARVDIRIADAAPRLRLAPETLDFGIARAGGGRTRRSFTLQNLGGPAAGRIAPPPPWNVEGADTYRLRRGQSATFTVVFEPSRAGRFETLLAFGRAPGQTLRLVAAGEPASAASVPPSGTAARSDSVAAPLPGPVLPPTAEAGPRVEFAPAARGPAEGEPGSPAAASSASTRGEPPAPGEPDAQPSGAVPPDWMLPAAPGGEWPLAGLRLVEGSHSGGRATLSWTPPPPPAAPAGYRLERRELFLDDARHLQVRWLPLPAEVRGPDATGSVSARVRGLPPEGGTALRLQVLDASGSVRGQAAGLTLDSPAPAQRWLRTALTWLLAAAALAATTLAWRRRV